MSPQVLSKEGPEKRVARASPADSPPSKKRAASQGESASTMEKNYKDLFQCNTRDSPLLRLPAEIRIAICEFVFSDTKWLIGYAGLLRDRDVVLEKQKTALSLTCICHQMHNEIALLPFSAGTLSFKDPEALEAFLSCVNEEKMRAISTVELRCRVEIDWNGRPSLGTDWPSALSLLQKFPNLKDVNVRVIRTVSMSFMEYEVWGEGEESFNRPARTVADELVKSIEKFHSERRIKWVFDDQVSVYKDMGM